MMDSGIERDNIHYNLSEDEGYNCPIMAIISPREPGKTTSITLDRVYADFRKKGLPAVALVNQAVDCTEAFMQSFENTINEFKGYEIHTKYTKGGIKGGICTIYEKDTDKPFIHVISLSTPLTRLKRINLGKVSCMWYDEAWVNVSVGERWPDSIATKWNELYTTLARKSYPERLKFYMTGNFYSRYHPILTYLDVDCSQLSIGKKVVHRQAKKVDLGDGKVIDVDYSCLVDCYNLKPELREYILRHNPGYVFDDTYQKYFEGVAVGDLGLPINPDRPEGYRMHIVFRVGQRYLYVWKNHKNVDMDSMFWMEATGTPPGKRKDTYIASLQDMTSHSLLSSMYRQMFSTLRYFIGRGRVEFGNVEAFYMMQELYTAI